MPGPKIEIDRIDHFVLRVTDVDRTCEFYEKLLGMRRITFGDTIERSALRFGDHKLNLHPATSDWHPRARDPAPGGEDFCLIARTPIAELTPRLDALGTEIEMGPGTRTGALGAMESVYFRDPDGNLVEISNYAGEFDRSAGEDFVLDRVDHVVMRVRDLDATRGFYCDILGMTALPAERDLSPPALGFGRHKFNLHPDHTDWPRARDARTGGQDFCLLAKSPMADIVAALKAGGVEIEVPPSTRNGALGPINSVYCRDPDGNLVELSNLL
jgi:catechol 2,3-dioxygenase-like lactoylglutathione lyase family enzyme